MALCAGNRIGQYEILAQIGAGGMGEVYRAKDTTLKREVALKVLPDAFAHDSARMARFQREAEVLASLNHPKIGAIYGVADDGAVRALVMELVEGPTLADRIAAGALPCEESLDIAKQMTEALEYAHEKGVVHRDLKPANVKITPEGAVKLLDFGLAKAFSDPAIGDSERSPTLTNNETRAGIILGTAAYMAPEQARGKPADKRADIWAFGVVLYEMLTGKRMHTGETVSDVLAAVISQEPALQALPARIRPVIEKCLRKDPRLRWRDIGDVRMMLEEAAEEHTDVPAIPRLTGRHRWFWPAVSVVFILMTAAVSVLRFRETTPAAQAVRLQIPVPENMTFTPGTAAAVSPDGHWIAFAAADSDNVMRMWVRALDSLEVKALEGSEIGGDPPPPFWSPDSRFIAFAAAQRTLKRVAITGGPPQTVCGEMDSVGGAWNREGVVVVGSNNGALTRCTADKGTMSPMTTIAAGEIAHRWPQFLPDGRRFLYTRTASAREKTGIFVGSLDAKPGEQSTTPILVTDRQGYYVPAKTGGLGWLLFVRDGTILAQRFDPLRLELSGDPATVAGPVGSYPSANHALFSVSDTGILVYRSGIDRWQLTWFDARGDRTGFLGEPGMYRNLSLSPDGTRVAVSRISQGNSDIWVLDTTRGTSTRLTFDPARDDSPVWSPDGSRIVFASDRAGVLDLYQKASDGSGDDQLLLKSDEFKRPESWSPNDKYLLYRTGTAIDLWVLPFNGDRKPIPFQRTEFIEAFGRFSPDSRWIAYSSSESGIGEIYVRPFSWNSGRESSSSSAGKWMISRGGGTHPRWRADGKELFYVKPGGQLMAVGVTTDKIFRAGAPRRLFDAGISVIPESTYAVAADGSRFLFNVPQAGAAAPPFTVVLNWQAALEH